jgi:trehalose 6-phosphate phosphatase
MLDRAARRGTRALFADRVWPAVVEALGDRDSRLLIALDLDGTLAPIVSKPESARVPAATLRLLERAARIPRVFIAVVTARRRRDLDRLVPVRGIVRSAQYGLQGPLPLPAARRRRLRAAARRIAALLAPIAAKFEGAWIEAKDLTVAIHSRGVGRARVGALRKEVAAISGAAARLGFAPIRGREVVEFAPRGAGKDHALRSIRRRVAPRVVFYFGDSVADEPAFAILGARDFSVRVGAGRTRARFRVRDHRDVSRVLRALLSARAT